MICVDIFADITASITLVRCAIRLIVRLLYFLLSAYAHPPMRVFVILHRRIFSDRMEYFCFAFVAADVTTIIKRCTRYLMLALVAKGLAAIDAAIPVALIVVPKLIFAVVAHRSRDFLSFAQDTGRFIRAGSNMCTRFTGLSTAAVPDQPVCCIVIVPERLAGMGELESLPFSAASHTFIGRSTGSKMLFPFSNHLITTRPERCMGIAIDRPTNLCVVADFTHNTRRTANRAGGRIRTGCLMRAFINIGLAGRAVLAMGGTQVRPGRAHIAMPNIFRIGMTTGIAYTWVCTLSSMRANRLLLIAITHTAKISVGVTQIYSNKSIRIMAYKDEIAISRTAGKAEVLIAISSMSFCL